MVISRFSSSGCSSLGCFLHFSSVGPGSSNDIAEERGEEASSFREIGSSMGSKSSLFCFVSPIFSPMVVDVILSSS